MSLKQRVYLANAVLLAITVAGAIAMIWYSYRTDDLFSSIVDRHVPVYQAAEALETSLLNQKGYLSYYLMDDNKEWLGELTKFQKEFNEHLARIKPLVAEPWEKEAVDRISKEYAEYIASKDRVIGLYRQGHPGAGASLHREVRASFFKIIALCEKFKAFHKENIDHSVAVSRVDAGRLKYISVLAIVTVVLLSLLINYIFSCHILEPIRKLAEEADRMGQGRGPGNELAVLKRSVHGLIEDAEQTHVELLRSRESLMQSEKMAMVGRLAAGTAHSIRNPLTSIKMRLFSLGKSGTEAQQEHINVITGEIGHINQIVENFLEFARPPKLTMKEESPSQVVDNTLKLLELRLKSYGVIVELNRSKSLPETLVDPGQLKEALANIIINACEAMAQGGRISISETEKSRAAVIQIQDNGPGIPKDIQEQVFNPFFTTKEEGTGLGLSIAFNIISEHGGCLILDSSADRGTCFTITLPLKGGTA